VTSLQQISRRAVATIDLAAIRSNIQVLRDRLRTGTRLCAVVKADAYGHGAVPVGKVVLAAGAEMLAVATASEAQALRDGGIEARILVLGPLTPCDFARANGCGAEVVVWSERFARHVARSGATVHVKLDTGMGRLGARDPRTATRLIELLSDSARVDVIGAMTHFATADELDSGFAHAQLSRFKRWAQPLRALNPALILHAANSAAALSMPHTHLDMVRIGLAQYGMDPFQSDARRWGLRPALKLTSYVADVKDCLPGQSVGYGRAFVADRRTRVATVPIGYADGVRRALGGRGSVAIRGQAHPIAGQVSMDMLAVEVGNTDVNHGDEVELIGPTLPAEAMAAALATINYEITCGLSARVARVYRHDD
jgi:alanine racemase